MDLFLLIGATALVAIAVSFVLFNHWREFHGGNRY